jgi:hypothetical protein
MHLREIRVDLDWIETITCESVLLGFNHRLNYGIIKLQRFESWILFPSSGKNGEEERRGISLVRWLR